MVKVFILILTSILPWVTVSVSVSSALDVITIGKDVIISLNKIWKLVDVSDYEMFGNKIEGQILRSIQTVNYKLDSMNQQYDTAGIQTLNIMMHLPRTIRVELKLNDLIDFITRINLNYRYFGEYTKNESDIERHTLEDFATLTVSHDPGSTISLLERIHAFIVPHGIGISNSGVLNLIKQSNQVGEQISTSLIIKYNLKFKSFYNLTLEKENV